MKRELVDLNENKNVFAISALSALGFRIASSENLLTLMNGGLDFNCVSLLAKNHLDMSFLKWQALGASEEKSLDEKTKGRQKQIEVVAEHLK